MSDTAIRVENLGKRYRIGAQQKRHDTLRDAIASRLQRSNVSSFQGSNDEWIWSLRNVSFEVKRGEVVGVIGRNGAGKSTLLKILSRITEPSEGWADMYGRVASLLEVGTGFHGELTGRENLYLSGAIMGMRKAEVDRKFDEIVAFAEVEKFIDTPVKHYSSGMYVRLAFAVAAHLEPEILLVDEVLAVGDAAFQKKCLGKIGDVAREGRTVLFVSHNMGAVTQLCTTAFLISSGMIETAGETERVVSQYLNDVSVGRTSFVARKNYVKEMFVSNAQAMNIKNDLTTTFKHTEPIIIKVNCKINRWIPNTVMGFFIRDQRGRKVFTNNNPRWNTIDPEAKEIVASVTIPSDFLVPGQYVFTFAITVHRTTPIDWAEDILAITVVDAGSVFASYEGQDYGCVFADCIWSIEEKEMGPLNS